MLRPPRVAVQFARAGARVVPTVLGVPAVLVVLTLVAACGSGEAKPEAPRPSPWIEASALEHDFGALWHGERPAHVFALRNVGPQRLRVRSVKSSCSCARTELRLRDGEGRIVDREVHDPPLRRDGDFFATSLEPGESLEVVVSIDTELREPKPYRERGETIVSMSPREAGDIRLVYPFVIRPRILVSSSNPADPARLTLPVLGPGQKAFAVFELVPAPGQPTFRVLGVDGAEGLLRLGEIDALEEGGHRYELELGPLGRPGPFDRELRFRTDLPGAYVLSYHVLALVQPNLVLVPDDRLAFGRFDFADAREVFVTIRDRVADRELGLEVASVEVVDGQGNDLCSSFACKLERAGPSDYTLSLRYRGGLRGSLFRGAVRLASADTDQPTLRLPISGFAER